MGGVLDSFAQAVFDPANVSGAFGNQRSPGRAYEDFADPRHNPRNANGVYIPPPVPDAAPSVWQREGGFLGPYIQAAQQAQAQIRDRNALSLDTAPYQQPEPPRVAPFAAQWSYTPGKGPQWLEPVDNGTSLQPKRQGDLSWNETVDNGWSSKISPGPAKGNRF